MVGYPLLTKQQQKDLPKLKQVATALPILFEDSTHQLWYCETVDGPMLLKVCQHSNVKKSAFWQGMNSLFNADFPASLSNIATVYQKIANISDLAIPQYIASESNSFVLATWLAGEMVEQSQTSDEMIIQLADHIAQCHRHTQPTWGHFDHAVLPAKEWPMYLSKTIEQLVEQFQVEVSGTVLVKALQQASEISTTKFVPIMLDLRWDQFLQQNNQLSALVDLDAFVMGPRELDWIILEYILTQQQAVLFKQHYQQHHLIPALTEVRTCYRLLLFLMGVLGETSLKEWLNVPAKF